MSRRGNLCINIVSAIIFCNFLLCINKFTHAEDDFTNTEIISEEEIIEINYFTPKAPPNAYLFETFDDEVSFEKKWMRSKAKKDDVDANIAKYNGLWAIEQLEKDSLPNDQGLVLKSKAKHAAISISLNRPFVFNEKPFIVQYEVSLQNGQECGGAYIKLLSYSKVGNYLNTFNDKTPYTIMFGPDKCGNDHKLHFIFRHVNPLTKEIEEKHCKKPKDKLEAPFKDKRPHLYTLILHPDNTFEVMLDYEVINSGHLLEDFVPPVNPSKEIDDPNDVKPNDWDEREKIPDPSAVKPEDWDEDAPRQIINEGAVKPSGWLDDEPDLVPDPEAAKPEDWDNEMDGEWEAPLISNPICEEAPGCGPWKAPVIDNPAYKGKWNPRMISNPNYKGKWAPRKIFNPDFFEDIEPFKMTAIGALGLELWSMSDGIYFDNFLITDSIEEAREIRVATFDLKIAKHERGQKGFFSQIIDYTNQHPWMYGVFVLVLAVPVVFIVVFCCSEDKSEDKAALNKKTDDPSPDDEVEEGVVNEAQDMDIEVQDMNNEVQDMNSEVQDMNSEVQDMNNEVQDMDNEAQDMDIVESDKEAEDLPATESDKEVDQDQKEDAATKSESGTEKSDEETRKSPRLRKMRKE